LSPKNSILARPLTVLDDEDGNNDDDDDDDDDDDEDDDLIDDEDIDDGNDDEEAGDRNGVREDEDEEPIEVEETIDESDTESTARRPKITRAELLAMTKSQPYRVSTARLHALCHTNGSMPVDGFSIDTPPASPRVNASGASANAPSALGASASVPVSPKTPTSPATLLQLPAQHQTSSSTSPSPSPKASPTALNSGAAPARTVIQPPLSGWFLTKGIKGKWKRSFFTLEEPAGVMMEFRSDSPTEKLVRGILLRDRCVIEADHLTTKRFSFALVRTVRAGVKEASIVFLAENQAQFDKWFTRIAVCTATNSKLLLMLLLPMMIMMLMCCWYT